MTSHFGFWEKIENNLKKIEKKLKNNLFWVKKKAVTSRMSPTKKIEKKLKKIEKKKLNWKKKKKKLKKKTTSSGLKKKQLPVGCLRPGPSWDWENTIRRRSWRSRWRSIPARARKRRRRMRRWWAVRRRRSQHPRKGRTCAVSGPSESRWPPPTLQSQSSICRTSTIY